MSRDATYLLDILESSRLAMSHLGEMTKQEFLNNVEKQDSVIRRLTIIGEAAGQISDQTRSQLPDLPWGSMIGMRNFMIHKYDDVDMVIVWDTVRHDLPVLITRLEEFLSTQDLE